MDLSKLTVNLEFVIIDELMLYSWVQLMEIGFKSCAEEIRSYAFEVKIS